MAKTTLDYLLTVAGKWNYIIFKQVGDTVPGPNPGPDFPHEFKTFAVTEREALQWVLQAIKLNKQRGKDGGKYFYRKLVHDVGGDRGNEILRTAVDWGS